MSRRQNTLYLRTNNIHTLDDESPPNPVSNSSDSDSSDYLFIKVKQNLSKTPLSSNLSTFPTSAKKRRLIKHPTCPDCQIPLHHLTPTQRSQHISTHNPVKCYECNKKLARNSCIKSHVKTQHPK